MSTDKVSTLHPLYEANIFTWRQVRDCVEGEAQIKRRDEVYLPMPSAMLDYNAPSPSIGSSSSGSIENKDKNINKALNPNYHTNAPYMAYKTRAHFPDITGFTLRGLIGIATRKDATIKVSSKLDYLEGTLEESYTEILNENLQTGRVPVLVDINNNLITLNINTAESLINWKEDDNGNLILAVFEEFAEDESVYESNTTDYNYRVLTIEDGKYTVTVYNGEGVVVTPAVVPTYFGKPLTEIPLVIIGSTNLTQDPDIVPLGSISSVALQIYMKSADLSQAEFLTCNPTLIFTGVTADNVPKAIGSVIGVALPDSDMKAEYTKTDTAGLNHVMDHIERLFEQAAAYGSNLLGVGKSSGGVESGEALRLKQTANSATLQSVVTTTSNGLQECLRIIGDWTGTGEEALEFEAVKELVDLMLSAQEVTSLVNAWMAGAISKESLGDVLRRMGLFIDNRTTEEELQAILEATPDVPDVEDTPTDDTEDAGVIDTTDGTV